MKKAFLLIFILSVPAMAFAAPNVSRTSGVAPLAVWCDADAEASDGSGADPFRHYEYRWLVNADMGNWGTSGKAKNVAYGGSAAFVFETAGTYVISLRVLDSGGAVVEAAGNGDTFTITVTDPDTVFAGALTTCVNQASDSDFTGCPSGANHVSTDDLVTLAASGGYAEAGERILIKRGNSWSGLTDMDFPDNTGPVTIGAYGTCTSPDSLTGICSNAPSFTFGDIATNEGFCRLSEGSGKRDWRIQDLTFTFLADDTDGVIFGGGTDMRQITILRIKGTGGGDTPIGWAHWNNDAADFITQMAVISCESQGNSNSYYVGAHQLAVLGNVGYDSSTTHILRVWQAYKSAISHNILSGSSISTNSGRHAIKLYSPGTDHFHDVDELCSPADGGLCLEYRTEFCVISDNTIGKSGPYPISIGPQDEYHESNSTDLIFERNRIVWDYGNDSPASDDVQRAIDWEAALSTIRNNTIDLSNSASTVWSHGIHVSKRAALQNDPDYNEIYNNTIYRSDDYPGAGTISGIWIEADADQTTIRNNLVAFLQDTETTVIDSGTNTISSNNVSTNSPYFTDPDNATALSRDFTLTASSAAAIDQGYASAIPAWDDFAGLRRTGLTYDVGAHEYGAPGEDQRPARSVGTGPAATIGTGPGFTLQ